LTGQTGFLIFRLSMIVYYFAQDCTQLYISPPRSYRRKRIPGFCPDYFGAG
jgi:hypothetical protein